MIVKLSAAFVSIFVLAFLIVYSPLFKVKEVILKDDQECLENQSASIEDKFIGQNIIFLNSQEIAKDLKREIICIEEIEIKKKFLDQILVSIVVNSAVANIDGTDLQVTKNGILLKKDDHVNLPTIFLPADSKIELYPESQVENKLTLSAIQIAVNLLKSDFPPVSIRLVNQNEIAVYSWQNTLAIFTSQKGIENQVNSLQLILGKAKIDAAKIVKIDLRFDKPVITYE